MKKIITDSPSGNTELMHNRVFVKDGYVWLRRMGEHGEDIDLIEYCKQKCNFTPGCHEHIKQCNDADSFGDLMMDCDCNVAYLYWLAVGFAEVRQRLMKYENGEALKGGICENRKEEMCSTRDYGANRYEKPCYHCCFGCYHAMEMDCSFVCPKVAEHYHPEEE